MINNNLSKFMWHKKKYSFIYTNVIFETYSLFKGRTFRLIQNSTLFNNLPEKMLNAYKLYQPLQPIICKDNNICILSNLVPITQLILITYFPKILHMVPNHFTTHHQRKLQSSQKLKKKKKRKKLQSDIHPMTFAETSQPSYTNNVLTLFTLF